MDLKRFDRIFWSRAIGSAAIFSAFVGLGTWDLLQGTFGENPTPVVATLLVAYFLLPRRGLPRGYTPGESEEEQQLLFQRKDLERRLRRVQIFYFFSAFLLLAMVPFLVGEPIFRMS